MADIALRGLFGAAPAGTDKQVQYNNNGATAGFGEYDSTTGALTVSKSLLVSDIYAITAVTTAAQTRTLDLANGAIQTISTNDDFTMDFTGPAGKAGHLALYVYNSTVLDKTMSGGTGKFAGGANALLTASSTQPIFFFWDGTRMTLLWEPPIGAGDRRPT